jgi:hypothetical protein
MCVIYNITYVWQTCRVFKLLYDVQQVVSNWGLDVFVKKLILITKHITHDVHILAYYRCAHIYLYNIPGWSSFRGRNAMTTLDDKTSFGPPFVFCVLELSRKSPCLWAYFHSLSPLLMVSAKKGNFNTSQYEMLKLIILSSVVIRLDDDHRC